MIYKRRKINRTISIKNIALKATFKRIKGQVTGENINRSHPIKRLIFRLYKELSRLKKVKSKIGKDLDSSPRRYTDGKSAHEKLINTVTH